MRHFRLLLLAALTSAAAAQVDNLRITEVDPDADLVEVTNTGPAFVTASVHPFCHRFNYMSGIPAGTSFAAGQALLFSVAGLDDVDSDLWIYRTPPFTNAANIVHGVKYGRQPNVGRAGLAASVGLWPSASAFAPAPAANETLAYDGFGSTAHDWYVDTTPSLGFADPVAVGTVASTLAVPAGTERLEQVGLGETVLALTSWVVVDTGLQAGDFDMRIVADVNGGAGPAPSIGSTRWLRVHDQDASAAQNRFYSQFLSTGSTQLPYELVFDVNPLALPAAAAANRPRIVVQHRTPTGAVNTWGIEFRAFATDLIVLTTGGPPALAPLGNLPAGTWSRIRLTADIAAGQVTASLANGAIATLPIVLPPLANPNELRFCYRGEGIDNTATMLLDDIRIAFGNPALEVVRNATPPNAGVLLPGQTSGPVLGQVWDPRIQPLLANNLLDALIVTAPSVLHAPTPFGVLLVDPGLTVFQQPVAPGQPFLVPLPNGLVLMGAQLASQGISLGQSALVLSNAVDLTVGF